MKTGNHTTTTNTRKIIILYAADSATINYKTIEKQRTMLTRRRGTIVHRVDTQGFLDGHGLGLLEDEGWVYYYRDERIGNIRQYVGGIIRSKILARAGRGNNRDVVDPPPAPRIVPQPWVAPIVRNRRAVPRVVQPPLPVVAPIGRRNEPEDAMAVVGIDRDAIFTWIGNATGEIGIQMHGGLRIIIPMWMYAIALVLVAWWCFR